MKTIKRVVVSGAVIAGLFVLCLSAAAAASKPVDRVMLKDGKMIVVQGGEAFYMEQEVSLPHDITVMTNGTFKVKEGKERKLQEGQVLDSEGMLTSPNGTIVPVFDNIIEKNGRPLITKDGVTTPLQQDYTFPDGRRIGTDGFVTLPNGPRLQLLDGQMFTLEGKAIPSKDTITLRKGKVWVQKDGSLFEVTPGRSLMMNDGTKVLGDGTVIMNDGTERKLAEEEMLSVPGVVRK